MCVLAESIRINGGDRVRYVVFSNEAPRDPFATILRQSGVEILSIPFQCRPPEGFFASFSGAFYLLDAIVWASTYLDPAEPILFLDPDCLVTAELSRVESDITTAGAAFFDVKYPLEHVVNGLCRKDIWALEGTCFGISERRNAPRWLGGEFIGLDRATATMMSSFIRSGFERNISLHLEGLAKYNTEEQFISGLVHANAMPFFDSSDGHVARIWTARSFRNFSAGTANVPVWHLPAEKARGFLKTFNMLAEGDDNLAAQLRERTVLQRRFGLSGDPVREIQYALLQTYKLLSATVSGRIANHTNHG
jgi:hypothetical protein